MKYHNYVGEFGLKSIGVFSIALLILINRMYSGSLMVSSSIKTYLFEEKETFYNLFLSTQISQFIALNFIHSLLFDFILLFLPILFVVSLKRIFAVLFSIFITVYFLTFNMVTGHHYHSLIGVIIITAPFWFKKEERFNTMWELARYYWLYVFASAALWKIFRGTVFYTDQLSNILKAQQLDLLIQNPDSFHAHVVQYLIAHPNVSHWVLVVNVVLQLCFVAGFFTKRFDAMLFWLAIVFCIANYFVMSIVSVELLILNLTLLNWDRVQDVLAKLLPSYFSASGQQLPAQPSPPQ